MSPEVQVLLCAALIAGMVGVAANFYGISLEKRAADYNNPILDRWAGFVVAMIVITGFLLVLALITALVLNDIPDWVTGILVAAGVIAWIIDTERKIRR